MKSIQIEFSKYESVNFLWSELIEHYGFEKAKKIVSQAIDLQKMNGNKNVTMPIIFSGTGGLALIPIKSLKDQYLYGEPKLYLSKISSLITLHQLY